MTRRNLEIGAALLLLAAILIAYSPVWNGERIWDDHLLLGGQNPTISGEGSWFGAFTEGFLPFEVYYRPLTAISFRFLLGLGEDTLHFHLVNLLLHWGVTLFVYALSRWVGTSQVTAWLVAAMFALHPALTESVAWISGMGDILGAALIGGAFLVFLRAGESVPAERVSPFGIGLSALLVLFAAFSKETVALLPIFLWMSPLLVRQERSSILVPGYREGLARLFVVGALPWAAALLLFHLARNHALHIPLNWIVSNVSLDPGAARESFAVVRDPELVLTLAGKYFGLLLAPLELNLSHVIEQPGGLLESSVLAGTLGTVTFVAICLATWRLRPRLLVPAFWGAATLVPALMFVPPGGNLFAERYLYLPAIGILPFLVGAIEAWWIDKGRELRPVWIAFLVLAIVGGGLTANRARIWCNESSVFQDSIDQDSRAYALVANLGLKLRGAGDTEGAISLYERTLALSEREPLPVLTDLDRSSLQRIAFETGTLHAQAGRMEPAEAAFRTALFHDHTDERVFVSLSAVLGTLGRYEDVVELLTKALRTHPNSTPIRRNLAMCWERLGRIEEARLEYEEILKLNPDDGAARASLSALGPR